VGFSSMKTIPLKSKRGNFLQLFSKKKQFRNIDWTIPGIGKKSIVFDPCYSIEVLKKFYEIVDEYLSDPSYHLHKINLDRNYMVSSFKEEDYQEFFKAATVLKTYNSYGDYLSSLDEEYLNLLDSAYEQMQASNIQIHFYPSFQDVFKNKPNSTDLYLEFKNDEELKPYIKRKSKYITLERDGEILFWGILLKKDHNLYFDISFDPILIEHKPLLRVCMESILKTFYYTDAEKLLLLKNFSRSQDVQDLLHNMGIASYKERLSIITAVS
jgi:hypothetical protein